MSTAELVAYFTAEKHGAIVIACIGIVSAIFGAYLWRTGSPFKAMMWPLLIIGLAQIALGVGLFLRTDPQVARIEDGLRTTPQITAAAELARMTKVNRSFKVIIAIEVVVILAGVILAVALRSRQIAWAAVGMGLVVQAAVTLVFDLFAEYRALAYTRWLTDFSDRLS